MGGGEYVVVLDAAVIAQRGGRCDVVGGLVGVVLFVWHSDCSGLVFYCVQYPFDTRCFCWHWSCGDKRERPFPTSRPVVADSHERRDRSVDVVTLI